jgi:hypothetical protein
MVEEELTEDHIITHTTTISMRERTVRLGLVNSRILVVEAKISGPDLFQQAKIKGWILGIENHKANRTMVEFDITAWIPIEQALQDPLWNQLFE